MGKRSRAETGKSLAMIKAKRTKKRSTSRASIAQVKKDNEALALRASGKGYDEIAKALGYTNRSGAYKAVLRVLDRWTRETGENVETVRSIELRRCDSMIVALWPAALRGDPQAIDRVIKIMDRRAKFLGLDAPTKQEVSGPDGEPVRVEDARTFLAEAIARVAADAQPVAESEGAGEPSG